ncbi:hypothetical protein [Stakelama pacifica]|uniref:Uncharacterized protein n=1 Tax=Stakelama pacifica TaxID=517720 RepID=A0A4R6FN45_9SPHN|nr:hypothetical protein [Stakelama pacifica]TDN83012.1 hypothetical protein EV664_105210 [Stakelama pacifica]GGO94933.1 hypothetical protein GCM10011329_17930 [Stakelama pacifica]
MATETLPRPISPTAIWRERDRSMFIVLSDGTVGKVSEDEALELALSIVWALSPETRKEQS